MNATLAFGLMVLFKQISLREGGVSIISWVLTTPLVCGGGEGEGVQQSLDEVVMPTSPSPLPSAAGGRCHPTALNVGHAPSATGAAATSWVKWEFMRRSTGLMEL